MRRHEHVKPAILDVQLSSKMTFAQHAFTEQRLRASWEACRRPTWPDFASSMSDPIISRLVMLYALHGKPRGAPQIARRASVSKPVIFDRKRIASGEREED